MLLSQCGTRNHSNNAIIQISRINFGMPIIGFCLEFRVIQREGEIHREVPVIATIDSMGDTTTGKKAVAPQKAAEEPLSLGLTAVTTFANGIKPVLVAAFTGVEMASSAVKSNTVTGRLVEAADQTVLLPVRMVQAEVEDTLFQWSNTVHAKAPVAASLANSHPTQFIASTAVGAGAVTSLLVRSVVKVPAFGVLKTGALLALPVCFAFSKVSQFKFSGYVPPAAAVAKSK